MAQVLIADDDGDIREVLTELLTDAGHQVVSVADGEAAWDILRASRHGMVAILDGVMPRLDGLGVLRKVLADPPLAARHGLILLTGLPLAHSQVISSDRSSDLPTDVLVIAKPFNVADIERAVESVAGRMGHAYALSPG